MVDHPAPPIMVGARDLKGLALAPLIFQANNRRAVNTEATASADWGPKISALSDVRRMAVNKMKVMIISIDSAIPVSSEGIVVAKFPIFPNTPSRIADAAIAPENCASQYKGTKRRSNIPLKKNANVTTTIA